MNSFISERVIEDILATDKSILSDILSVNASDLSLIARQKIVSSGKLDLLYLCKDEIFLIELKIVSFYKDIITQINNYEKDLIDLQNQNKIVHSKIKKIIFVIGCRENDYISCKENNIELLLYKPEAILSKYYENFKELSTFLNIQSGDFGVVRLGLIKNTLNDLAEGLSIKEICKLEMKSEKTIKNKISVAQHLNLVSKFKTNFFLTDLGNSFVELGNKIVDDRLNQHQIDLITSFINENPFYSPITYTIYSLIESVFVLSKTSYPVPKDSLKDYFVKSVAKTKTWRMPRARETATYIFSNYACELEYLAKVNNEFFLTPKGIQAILLLQLNRSIKLIESRK
ncbi:MAG: hypothetical protein A2V93_09285 [Ignavibacteria bacterium RBG_16_34_14]|nr:MAG: hypothetical protein A2V93_09285 [Ignavibacteria bacterium RBG_16_34_14]